MSERLPPEFDLRDVTWSAASPSTFAYQCQVCQGIAFNPVCPYCADEDDTDEEEDE